MYTKPPMLWNLSIRQPVQTNNVLKQKNKTKPIITTKTIPKPNALRTTSNFKQQQYFSWKNTFNVRFSETPINTDYSKQSFASTEANSSRPKKYQTIIIVINDNFPHKNNIIANDNKLVQLSNILFGSRIFKGRIYINLSSKSLVDNLIENHPIITTQEHFKLHKLFNPKKKIILSNVRLNILPEIIINEFVKLKISLCSPITFLKTGIQVEDFTYILSFCRWMFIQLDDLKKCPPSILINYEHTNYRIFLPDDSLTGYLCKSQGHIASQWLT